MKRLHLIALAPLALAACKGSGDTITNNNAAVTVAPDAVVVNGVTYVREKPGGAATTTPAPTFSPVAAPTIAPVATPTVPPPASVDPADLPPTQPSPGDGHGG